MTREQKYWSVGDTAIADHAILLMIFGVTAASMPFKMEAKRFMPFWPICFPFYSEILPYRLDKIETLAPYRIMVSF